MTLKRQKKDDQSYAIPEEHIKGVMAHDMKNSALQKFFSQEILYLVEKAALFLLVPRIQ